MNPNSLFGLSDHLALLSKHGDPLEVLDATVDFEYFRAGWLRAWDTAMAPRAAVRRLILCRCSKA